MNAKVYSKEGKEAGSVMSTSDSAAVVALTGDLFPYGRLRQNREIRTAAVGCLVGPTENGFQFRLLLCLDQILSLFLEHLYLAQADIIATSFDEF